MKRKRGDKLRYARKKRTLRRIRLPRRAANSAEKRVFAEEEKIQLHIEAGVGLRQRGGTVKEVLGETLL